MKKRNWFFLGALVLYVWESIVAFHWVRPVYVSHHPARMLVKRAAISIDSTRQARV